MVESAAVATRPRDAKGARPASQGAELGALAKAQLSGALRLVSGEMVDEVERFADPMLLTEGKIAILSLEAVQHGFGERWKARRSEVFTFANQVLERSLGHRGVHRRVSDTDFFVIHPHLGRLQGQAACLRYLTEIQTHFLDDAAHAVKDILQVTRVCNGRLETQPVDAERVEALARAAAPEVAPDGPRRLADFVEPGETAQPLANHWAPFAASDGRSLRISVALEPVYELKGFTRIGFRMIRRVVVASSGEALSPQQVSALSTADLLRADLATITRGIDRLQGSAEQQLSLIVPVSFSSLANPRGRAELVEPVRAAAALVKLGVICEILDIEGVPQRALTEVTSLIRPLSLLVVGRLANPTASAFARVAGSGFQALSFECPHSPQVGEAEFLGWATATLQAARKATRSVMVYRAGSMKRAGALAALGATHMSLDAS
ncbi:hypothetical protein [Phenylobacterium sp.]|uniref:hypothetical protein n=1 Tax=Phenylobacterium sp. TaxID=1871053 RepID=UPI00374CEF64